MAKPSMRGHSPNSGKDAYKKYTKEDSYDHNARNLEKSAGKKSMTNVSKPGSHSTAEDMPSKSMAKGNAAQ